MTNLNYSEIMVRYGELSTKGKNRMRFIGRLAKNIREVLTEFPTISVKAERDRAHIFLNGAEYGPLAEKLVKVFVIPKLLDMVIDAPIAWIILANSRKCKPKLIPASSEPNVKSRLP